ncbi:MAG: tetratricopeptide repeat protein [Fidelibacterota bacterium]|nr:MAG: tetratricopeptide repeat protein [Candidatus Neomarinimicrobiota bacterium]
MPDPSSRFTAFLAELKRRRVFRVAVVYAGIAFIIVQIMDGTFEPMGIPDWVSRLIIILLALGFPVSIGLAWAFDITDKGIVRTKGKPSAPTTPHHIVIGNKALAVIAVLAIIVAAWALLREPSPGGAVISSIAVLPLDNISGDPEQEYFTEGMHEAIITNLNRLSVLKVISRTSAMRYKDTEKLMPEIAQELNVDALVEGSVLKAGDRVRITAQLIHGTTDEHLWSNDYEGDLTDILVLQKTVARAIAGEIGLALKPEEEDYLASAPQVNPEAYDLYLWGWHFRSQEGSENWLKAVEYLEQSVALDSTFVQAWAALAHVYIMTGTRDQAKWAIDKALELDPDYAQAIAVLGRLLLTSDRAASEESFKRALELDPNNTYALYEYGLSLLYWGRPQEAMASMQRGHELEPLDPPLLFGIGWVYQWTRQYDEALKYLQACLELAPDFSGALGREASAKLEILMQQGRYAEVVEQRGINTTLGMRARIAMGDTEEVHAFLDSLLSSGEYEQENPYGAAHRYAIIGEREKALSLLEQWYESNPSPSFRYMWLVYDHDFDSLRAEPRFKALFQKLGLTEVFDQYGQRIR